MSKNTLFRIRHSSPGDDSATGSLDALPKEKPSSQSSSQGTKPSSAYRPLGYRPLLQQDCNLTSAKSSEGLYPGPSKRTGRRTLQLSDSFIVGQLVTSHIVGASSSSSKAGAPVLPGAASCPPVSLSPPAPPVQPSDIYAPELRSSRLGPVGGQLPSPAAAQGHHLLSMSPSQDDQPQPPSEQQDQQDHAGWGAQPGGGIESEAQLQIKLSELAKTLLETFPQPDIDMQIVKAVLLVANMDVNVAATHLMELVGESTPLQEWDHNQLDDASNGDPALADVPADQEPLSVQQESVGFMKLYFPTLQVSKLSSMLEAAGGDVCNAVALFLDIQGDIEDTEASERATQSFTDQELALKLSLFEEEAEAARDTTEPSPHVSAPQQHSYKALEVLGDYDEQLEEQGGAGQGDDAGLRKKLRQLQKMFSTAQRELLLDVLKNCEGNVGRWVGRTGGGGLLQVGWAGLGGYRKAPFKGHRLAVVWFSL